MSKERLVELLDEAFIISDDNYGMPNTNQVADYLLANGVVVLPCNGCALFEDNYCGRCGARMDGAEQ